jgi:hypothetical protein
MKSRRQKRMEAADRLDKPVRDEDIRATETREQAQKRRRVEAARLRALP